MTRLLSAFLAIALVASCGTPSRPRLSTTLPQSPRSPVGCWELWALGWEGPFLPGNLTLHLDTAFSIGADSLERVLNVRTADSVLQRRLLIRYWAPYEAFDSVYAVVGDGFSGLEFRLGTSGDSLVGRAYRFTDFTHARSSGPVAAVRRPC